MAKIGVIGNGYVGKSMVEFFERGNHEIIVYDSASAQTSDVGKVKYRPSINDIDGCEFIFICVPTPQGEDGSCDTSIVHSVIESLDDFKQSIIVIKSTVPVGTTQNIDFLSHKHRVVFSPEFSGENKYHTEHKFLKSVIESPFFIFGGYKADTEEVVNLYQKIGGPDKKYIQTSFELAELMKYVNNSFFALKVAFCNELFDLCALLDVSYNELRELWHLDPRNNKSFTSVFPDERGYGGKCFLKDVEGFVKLSEQYESPLTILNAARKSNLEIRNKHGQPIK